MSKEEKRFRLIPITSIEVSEQPRKDFKEIDSLAASIRELGLINPLIIEKEENGKFRLISGERRLKACKALGLTEVPCLIQETNVEPPILALADNIARQDLTILEEAEALYKLLKKRFGDDFFKGFTAIRQKFSKAELLTKKEKAIKKVIDTLGLSLWRAEDLIKVSTLPDNIKKNIVRSTGGFGKRPKGIPIKHAIQIARLNQVKNQNKIADRVIKDEATFDDTRTMVSFLIEQEKTKVEEIKWTKEEARQLVNAFLRVKYNCQKLIKNYNVFFERLNQIRTQDLENLKTSTYYLNQFFKNYDLGYLTQLLEELREKHLKIKSSQRMREKLEPKVRIQEASLRFYVTVFSRVGFEPFNSKDIPSFGFKKERIYDTFMKPLKRNNLISYELDYENQSNRIYQLQEIGFPITISGQRGEYKLTQEKFKELVKEEKNKVNPK